MSSVRTHLFRLAPPWRLPASWARSPDSPGAATSQGSAGSANGSGNSGSRAVPATLDGIKDKANTDVTNRVNDLNAAVAKVNAAKGLGSGQATLVTYLGTDISPLQQLNQKIQGDATVKQAAEDFSTIFTGYRVYVLVLPDRRRSRPGHQHRHPEVHRGLLEGQGLVNPQNQGQLQPLIDDLNSQISVATNATTGWRPPCSPTPRCSGMRTATCSRRPRPPP